MNDFFFNQGLSNNTLATNLGFHLPLMIPRPIMYKEDAFQFTFCNRMPSGRSRLEIYSMGGSLCLVTSLPHRRAGLQLPKLQSVKRIPYPLIWRLPPEPQPKPHLYLPWWPQIFVCWGPPSGGLAQGHMFACSVLILLSPVQN